MWHNNMAVGLHIWYVCVYMIVVFTCMECILLHWANSYMAAYVYIIYKDILICICIYFIHTYLCICICVCVYI